MYCEKKDKLSMNGTDVQKARYTQSIRDRKQRQQRYYIKDTQETDKIIRLPKIFSANLHFRLRDQKAYCDGHTDKVVYTIISSFR